MNCTHLTDIFDCYSGVSYLAIFFTLMFSGYLIPIPEEILLLIAGYVAGTRGYNVFFIAFFAALGVWAGDNMVYFLSRRSSRFIRKIAQRMDQEKLKQYEAYMHCHKEKAIFFFRFIIGLRFLSPFLAGSMRIPWKTFQIYNSLAVILYVSLMIFLGDRFRNHLESIVSKVEALRHLIFAVLIVVIAAAIAIFVKRKFFVGKPTK